MGDIAIRVENLGKKYKIGANQARYQTLRESIVNGVRNSIDRIKGIKPSEENIIWALKDINFEVKHGEVLGVIGRNGAGKSTLLKILSRITKPTTGRFELNGRVGSLLEVGTGFHPELTGRDNIYLSGAILGMKRKEINRKFDEIVDFAEIEKFLDTPAKHFSSGMYMRLAFSVAAHLEPEILLVDEVLAVGDAEFQKKCLGKMGDVAGQGRTVLFVSHNMGAILQLCNQTILFSKGKLSLFTITSEVISIYLKKIETSQSTMVFPEDPDKNVQILSMAVLSKKNQLVESSPHTAPIIIEIVYKIKEWFIGSYICLDIFNDQDLRLIWSSDVNSVDQLLKDRIPGTYLSTIEIPGNILTPGHYSFTGAIYSPSRSTPFDVKDRIISIEITDGGSFLSNFGIKPHSATMISLSWQTEQIFNKELQKNINEK